ncbi:hypothetical protein MVEN_01447500 [Mycena venus]|uniref:DUF6533 domain-containing protein n=1 Tax=Mycena venus TaxID=2733690 RepID=A0A8H6XUS6_9AGAR|nr:hypothetical protein MVEN_01447500 [Mycena venus]
MSSPFPVESHPEVFQVLSDARTTNSMILAALSLVVYDHIISFQDEVELMWKSYIHTTNVIYLWNRYCTLLALLINASVMLSPYKSDAVSVFNITDLLYFNTEAFFSTLILATVDLILVLRVWLLFEKARWLLYVLMPMIGLEILTMGLVSHYTIYTTKVFWPLGWPLTGCYPLGLVPRYFTFYSLPVLVVSATMFVLTVYKCGKTLLAHGRARMPIYNMFLRDGVFWFVAIFMTFLPEVVIWAAARQSLAELMIAPGLAVTSIIGSRVLLNIQRLKTPQNLPTTTTTGATTLHFAMGTTVELDTMNTVGYAGYDYSD